MIPLEAVPSKAGVPTDSSLVTKVASNGMIELHRLKPSQSLRRPKRVGRGNASGKGTTAGRGTKGQRARTGGRNKLTRRGLMQLIGRTPKTRGFRSRRPKLNVVSIYQLEQRFPEGTIITPAALVQAKLILSEWPGVKILGHGPIKKKLTVKAQAFSASAAEAIRAAGGTAVPLEPVAPPAVKPA